ncbi:MAG: alpha/beta hydrolase [Chloroflexi bacterium]|nr:alpha/beta hydrolase [Chloroflexota bacterium]
MRRAYADIPEGQVHYKVVGEGKPVLCLHQSPISSDEYTNVLPLLAPHFRAIAMDTMGYGLSDPHPRPSPQVPDYIQAIYHFIRALGIPKLSIVGIHTGATFAIELSLAHPEVVDKLVLCGVPLHPKELRESRLKDPAFHAIPRQPDGSHLMKIWNYYKDRWDMDVPFQSHEISFLAYYLAGSRVEDGHLAVFAHDLTSSIPRIKHPTLLLSGTGDVLHRYLDAVAKMIPGCKVATIEGGGIHVAVDKAEPFARAVIDFLK